MTDPQTMKIADRLKAVIMKQPPKERKELLQNLQRFERAGYHPGIMAEATAGMPGICITPDRVELPDTVKEQVAVIGQVLGNFMKIYERETESNVQD